MHRDRQLVYINSINTGVVVYLIPGSMTQSSINRSRSTATVNKYKQIINNYLEKILKKI